MRPAEISVDLVSAKWSTTKAASANLGAGQLHILASPPGTGKSTIALGLSVTISAGGLGGRCCPDRSYAKLGEQK